jgi:hypothetical protein
MAIRKSTLDISALDGLSQVTDPRRLPLGKAASAVNFVKSKQGRLQKRLGVSPLNVNTTQFGRTFSFSSGIGLAQYSGTVQAIGQGSWAPTNATVTAMSTYLDDTGSMVIRGNLPDFTVRQDKIIANAPGISSSVTSAYYLFAGAPFQDYLVTVWISTTSAAGSAKSSIWWSATNPATGSILVPPMQLNTGSPVLTAITYVRLAVVGSIWVCCYSQNDGNIWCQTMTLAQLLTGVWSSTSAIVTANLSTNGAFDMRAATGDTTHFLLAYSLTSAFEGVVVDRRLVATPSSFAQAIMPFPPAPADGTTVAYGIRADSGTFGRVALTFVNAPASSTSAYQIWAWNVNYPAMTSATAAISLYTGLTKQTLEIPPAFLEVAYCGGSPPIYAVSHTPLGAMWNAGLGYVAGNNSTLPDPTSVLVPSLNAAIITNQYEETGGSLAKIGSACGANARVTVGMTLASRCLEVNNIFYVLGWVPSNTQGGFILLAADWAVNTKEGSASTNPYPMRPVAQVQTRTALADPGYFPAGIGGHYGPNQWTGATEWTYNVVNYTAYGAYVSSTQGERLQPAVGQFATVPLSPNGYPSTEYGTILSVGGGITTCFDGSNIFEQAFLWAPESIAVFLGSSGGSALSWAVNTDFYSWIFTYEQFDAQGNFHISARSTPVVIDGIRASAVLPGLPVNLEPEFTIPTLGATMRQVPQSLSAAAFASAAPSMAGPITIGTYRTELNGTVYFRDIDKYFNNDFDNVILNDWTATPSTWTTTGRRGSAAHFKDVLPDGTASPVGIIGVAGLSDGSHPFLYGDGSNGAPGSLDNYCPPATSTMVRHKERIFVARNNQVLFTKQRSELAGPGYNEQVNSFFVGGDDPIIAMESMDGNLIVLKSSELYYVSGDGPADDGSGNSFSQPQMIPTDLGCVDPRSVQVTPEGIYFMSTAGLRLLSRNLAVSYVGGPVEDELATYPYVTSVTLHPSTQRTYFTILSNDNPYGLPNGEVAIRDYEFDAWTTMVVTDGETQKAFMSAVVAGAPRSGYNHQQSIVQPVLHLLSSDGVIWRENDPNLSTPYYDNVTYVQSSWTSPWIKPSSTANGLTSAGDQNWSRIWQTLIIGQSMDAHGIQFNYAIDYSGLANTVTWTWSTANTSQIAPNGVQWTPITQLEAYLGSRGEAFQFEVIDVVDPASVTGQGIQLLGLTAKVGTYESGFRLPQGARQ